eukprot:scaffold284465_cov24-Tisochrysis_lutea.AAC.1
MTACQRQAPRPAGFKNEGSLRAGLLQKRPKMRDPLQSTHQLSRSSKQPIASLATAYSLQLLSPCPATVYRSGSGNGTGPEIDLPS